MLAQEHKHRVTIPKSLIGVVEPEEQQEIDRLSRQRNAKNRGEPIQMPPLQTTVVEMYREYERANRAAKGMVEAYKKERRKKESYINAF